MEGAFVLPRLRSGMDVIDLGCGSGSITVGLAERVWPGRVLGIDADAGQVEEARIRAYRHGLPNASFLVAQFESIPTDGCSWDCVFMHTALQHAEEPERVLTEVHRVLRRSGVVALRDEQWMELSSLDPIERLVGQAD